MPKNIKPEATSTPKLLPHIKGRKGIKDHEYDESAQSPIGNCDSQSPKASPRKLRSSIREGRSPNLRNRQENSGSVNRSFSTSPHHSPSRPRSLSPSETSSEEENYAEEEISENSFRAGGTNEQSGTSVGKIILIVLIGFIGILVYGKLNSEGNPDFDFDTEIQKAEKEFVKQDKDFWIHIKSNLKEISLLKQPKTIMFLYKENSDKTVNKILNKVAKIAVCKLTSCRNKPVLVDGKSLNSSQFLKDYGKVISTYQKDLTKSGVLIVKNLEKVPGTVAQAFHSICDDYNPVVQNALILFTLKVDTLPEKVYFLNYLEKLFLKLWTDIGVDDKFYPLFTRITGTVLAIHSE